MSKMKSAFRKIFFMLRKIQTFLYRVLGTGEEK